MFRTVWLPISIVFSVLVLQSLAVAEEDKAFPIVEEWSIPAKAGYTTEFMIALKEHAIWRRDNGDPWHWEYYSSQTGREDAGVLVRSADHEYGDLDTYTDSEFSAKAAKHWDEVVAPYAGVGTRYLRFQTPATYWPDENYTYLLIMPVEAERNSLKDLTEAAIVLNGIIREAGIESAGGLEYTWSGGGHAFQYVEGKKDWASTSPGSPLAVETHAAIVEKLGEEETEATYEAAHAYHNSNMRIYKRLEW